MKKYVIMAALLVSGLTFAQEGKPKLEEVDGMVKATYYYENGQVQQEGFFKDGKLDGNWVSYNVDGTKKAVAQYTNGEKTGNWFFWSDKSLAEVDFNQGVIASIKKWNKEAIADKN